MISSRNWWLKNNELKSNNKITTKKTFTQKKTFNDYDLDFVFKHFLINI